MTVLQLLIDGALAAAQLLAMLAVPPAAAQGTTEPIAAALERPVALHRLSTHVDVRLLGAFADVRVAQHLRNDGRAPADLGVALAAFDAEADAVRVIRSAHAIDLAGDAAGARTPMPCGGHARLTDDEAIADALRLAPGDVAIIEAVAARPLMRHGRSFRVALPARASGGAPRATLVEQGDGAFIVIAGHGAAVDATVVLRPVAAPPEPIELGAVAADEAIVIPLPRDVPSAALAAGAIELELRSPGSTVWSTLPAVVVERRASVQAGVAD